MASLNIRSTILSECIHRAIWKLCFVPHNWYTRIFYYTTLHHVEPRKAIILQNFIRSSFQYTITCTRRTQWPRGLKHEPSSPAWTLGSWVGIPLEACLCAFILCVGRGLATGWSPVQGVLPTVYRLRNWKRGQGPKGCTAIARER
jgi:hypothetical protein